MTPTFEYRSVQQNFLDSYQASHTEQEFIASLETLLASKSVDQLLGGYQSTSPAGITKSLAENALFIDIFAQLASYYSHSGFSQAAATTGSLFVNYRDEPAGLFGDLISTHNSNLKATDIKLLLTPEQWN